MDDHFDILGEALNVVDEVERELSEEEEGALAAFDHIIALLPDQVIRGVRRALIEGWIDGQSTNRDAVYPSLMGCIEREMQRYKNDTLAKISRLSPPVVEFASAIQVFDNPDTSDVVCSLLCQITEHVAENNVDIWL